MLTLIRSLTALPLLALTLLALPASPALAWPEEPFAKIVLSGPGLEGSLEITDPALLESLTITGFAHMEAYIEPPSGLGEGYLVHRYFQEKSGAYWDFDQVRYYPDPQGGPGYLYYQEAIGYGPSSHAGRWYRMTSQGEGALQKILQTAAPVSASLAPQNPPAPAAASVSAGSAARAWTWASILAGPLALGAGALWIRRRYIINRELR